MKHGNHLKREIAEDFIGSVMVYGFDAAAASEASRVSHALSEKGKLTNENDILIAGTAIANNQILLTRDGGFNSIADERIVVV